MNDHDHLAAGLVFGGLEPAEEAAAHSLELEDPQFARLVAEYAETAAFVAQSDRREQPSSGITQRILAIPDDVPRPTDISRPLDAPGPESQAHSAEPPTADRPSGGAVSLDEYRRETSRWKRTALALGGLGAAASIGLGVVAISLLNERAELQEEVTAVQTETSDLNRLMLAEDLSIGEASLPGDETATITVMASVDESLVRVQTANVAIPEGQDMQMWLISDDGAEPMGLIDPSDPGVDSLPIPPGAELGFTMEPEGGAEELEGPPVVSIRL